MITPESIKIGLFGVTGHPGAHVLLNVRDVYDTDPSVITTIADVHLIGAPLPYCVPADTVHAYTPADAFPRHEFFNVVDLAQEAVLTFGTDPERVMSAEDLVHSKSVHLAQRNEAGFPITPSLDVFIVHGSRGWYVVRRGSCTCSDHTKGNLCKHRIAAWMYRELELRNLEATKRSGQRSAEAASSLNQPCRADDRPTPAQPAPVKIPLEVEF